jgi:hypothetical protein
MMQLRTARLCLDCEEVHDEYRCPVCASEAFTYLTRWVPAPERRSRPRQRPVSEDVEIYRRFMEKGEPARQRSFLAPAALGLTAASVLGLFWGGRKARAGQNDGQESDEPTDP